MTRGSHPTIDQAKDEGHVINSNSGHRATIERERGDAKGGPSAPKRSGVRESVKAVPARPSLRSFITRRTDDWRGVAARSTTSTESRPNAAPWLTMIDALGLLFALVTITAGIDATGPGERVFIALLAASSLYVWFLFSQFRSLDTILRRQRSNAYFIPSIAALSTFAILASAQSFVSVFGLVIFVGIWTGFQVLGRLIVSRHHKRLKILLVGDPSFTNELQSVPGLSIVTRSEPPERIQGWDIVISDPAEPYEPEWLQWMGHADMYGVKVLSAPLVLETLTRRVPIEMLSGRWAFEVLHGRSNYLFWKRLFDLVAVLLAAPLIIIVGLIVAIIVFIDTGRPILFWQERVGVGGRPFRMVKFRTMRTDAEEHGNAFATVTDDRVTKTGRFLRHFRLDEIPQLWNVLLGEMSIIGPRPEQKGFAEQFADEIPLYALRSNLRPGITGWAQVMHGYAADTIETETKLRYDFYYVKHCSFGLDARIVWKTILTILTGFGSR